MILSKSIKLHVLWQHIRLMSKKMPNAPTVHEKLRERGLISCTFPDTLIGRLSELTKENYKTVYAGFDPTADSLHIGNLVVLCSLLHHYAAGHNVIALVGGATAMLGDPSGKTSERPHVAPEVITKNSESLMNQLDGIFHNFTNLIYTGSKQSLQPVRIVNNLQWYSELNAVEFVAQVGRQFRLSHMMQKQMVKSRLQEDHGGLTLSEFCYQVFQAYDWVMLSQEFNCNVQLGGTDQIGNIHAGRDLVASVCKKDAVGLLMPLLTTTTGAKLGKSEGNSVWLDGEKTSPFELYQFFMRVEDADVHRYLQLFSFFSLETIEEITRAHLKKPEERRGQSKLAEQITTLLHGKEGLIAAKKCTAALYQGSPDDLAQLHPKEIDSVFKGMPRSTVVFRPGISLKELSMKAGCFSTDRDAERIIRQGGFYVNHVRVTEPEAAVVPGVHILPNGISMLRTGKRNYWLVDWTDF